MSKKSVSNVGKVYNQNEGEFRRDAVAMIESKGLTATEVGGRLGVNANLLRKWGEKYGKKSKPQEVLSDLEEKRIEQEATPQYLLFLKARPDGRYEPVSGQVDSVLSVRQVGSEK